MGQSKKMLLNYDDPTLLTGKQASYHTQEKNPELSLKISGPWAAAFFFIKKKYWKPTPQGSINERTIILLFFSTSGGSCLTTASLLTEILIKKLRKKSKEIWTGPRDGNQYNQERLEWLF